MKILDSQSYINETNNNFNWFVEYIKDYGNNGSLQTNVKNVLRFYLKNVKCNLNDFLQYTGSCSLSQLVYNYLVNIDPNLNYASSGDDLREKDNSFSFDKYVKDKNDFFKWAVDWVAGSIFAQLTTNKNGLIYIEREIVIPKQSNKKTFFNLLNKKYNGKLGIYWTYAKDNAKEQWSDYNKDNGDYVVLTGYVKPEDVNWTETFYANAEEEEEMELTVYDNAIIELNTIKEKNGNIIYDGQILLKA